MYPQISLALAEERVKDMRTEAAGAHRSRTARLARVARHGRRTGAAGHTRLGWNWKRPEQEAGSGVRVPDSFEDFLCQTAASATREPTATGRASGQTVR